MDSQEQERLIADLEVQVDRLRALYEQYFMGLEKLEPHVPRKAVERKIADLRRERMRTTAMRFKFQQIVQRYNTMQTYWRRVARQIEEGTYRRDLMRARARSEQREQESQSRRRGEDEEEEKNVDPVHEVNLDDFEDTDPGVAAFQSRGGDRDVPTNPAPPPPQAGGQPSVAELLDDPALGHGSPPPPPPAAAAPPPVPGSGPPPVPGQRPAPPPPPPDATRPKPPQRPAQRPAASASEQDLPQNRIQSIYRDYISARQRCNQSTLGLTLEKVSNQIRSQEAALRTKHGKDVDFKVTVREGKAVLRAVKKG